MRVALTPAEAIDGTLLAAWRKLEVRAATPANPFYASWFLQPAMRHLAPPQSIRLLTVWKDGDTLAALAPVQRGETYARLPVRHFATWRHVHGYNSAPLCAEGDEAAVYAALCAWIDARPDGARFLRFNEHPLPHGLPAPADRKIAVEVEIERAILTAGPDFETAYARGFSGKKRKELRRQWRRLAEDGALALERLTAPEAIARAAQDFIALETAGWKGRTKEASPIGASEAEILFFREAMTGGAAQGAVICDRATFDGKPIAMLFSLRCGSTLSAYKISYDEAFAAYSPGVHVLVEAMRLMLADPSIALFDSCAKQGHPVADHLWRERMRVAQFNLSGAGRLDRALFGAAAALSAMRRTWIERGVAPRAAARMDDDSEIA